MGRNQTIVFTNGCFDLYILAILFTKASRLGSKLIVGLNSDKSVKELKGLADHTM